MSMQSIPSGRARRVNPVRGAVIITTVVLGILALLGVDIAVVALLGLMVLGSILILADPSASTDKPPTMMI